MLPVPKIWGEENVQLRPCPGAQSCVVFWAVPSSLCLQPTQADCTVGTMWRAVITLSPSETSDLGTCSRQATKENQRTEDVISSVVINQVVFLKDRSCLIGWQWRLQSPAYWQERWEEWGNVTRDLRVQRKSWEKEENCRRWQGWLAAVKGGREHQVLC